MLLFSSESAIRKRKREGEGRGVTARGSYDAGQADMPEHVLFFFVEDEVEEEVREEEQEARETEAADT
jgi:hypothetical protein